MFREEKQLAVGLVREGEGAKPAGGINKNAESMLAGTRHDFNNVAVRTSEGNELAEDRCKLLRRNKFAGGGKVNDSLNGSADGGPFLGGGRVYVMEIESVMKPW